MAYTGEIGRRNERRGIVGVAKGGGKVHGRSDIGDDIEGVVCMERAGRSANGMRHDDAM